MDLNTAIDVIESVAGFTDPDTSVGEAWAVVMAQLEAAPVPAGERQVAPVPVAVSERLPGAEDCDAEGRCWLLTVEDEYPQWRLHSVEGNQPGGETLIWVPVDSSPGVMVDCFYASHWLPAHALPLPAATDCPRIDSWRPHATPRLHPLHGGDAPVPPAGPLRSIP